MNIQGSISHQGTDYMENINGISTNDKLKERCQILSIDGGGIIGLFSAFILAAIEDDLNVSLTDHFDLITGTSTGGIIAIALAIGISPKEIVDFYLNDGPIIFSSNMKSIRQLFCSKYDSLRLREALKRRFGNKTIADCQKRLLIPAFDIDKLKMQVFKTRHHEDFVKDHKIPLWKVAMATTAAPTYFDVSDNVNNVRLIDGAICANNPSLLGITEAIKYLDVPIDNIYLLNIGATTEVNCYPTFLNRGGILQWAWYFVNMFLQAQSYGMNQHCKLLLQDRSLRVDAIVQKGKFKMDKLNLKELESFASTASQKYMPEIKKLFIEHKATPFNPI